MWVVLEAGGFEEKASLSPGWGQLPWLPPVSVPSPAPGCLCRFGKLFVCSAGSKRSPRVGRASPKRLGIWQCSETLTKTPNAKFLPACLH